MNEIIAEPPFRDARAKRFEAIFGRGTPRCVLDSCIFAWHPRMGTYATLGPKYGYQRLQGTFSNDAAGKRVYDRWAGLVRTFPQNVMPITGAQEPAITNRCLQSQTLGTTWVPSNVTVGDNETGAPDGTTTADSLTATAANGTLIQDCGVLGSAAYTFSIWLKRKTGTGNIDLTLDNGSTWTTKTITSEWVRYQITQTLANPDCGIRIVTDTDAIYAWGGQVEANSYPTSYIPTTTAAVARSEDAFRFINANLFGGLSTRGSMVFVLRTPYAYSGAGFNFFGGINAANSVSNYLAFVSYSTVNSGRVGPELKDAGSVQARIIDTSLGAYASNSWFAVAVTWEINNIAAYYNGSLLGTDTAATIPSGIDRLEIGSHISSGGRYGSDHALVALFDRILTAAEAQALTLNPERYVGQSA